MGGPDPHFFGVKGRTPQFINTPGQKFCLVPQLFRTKLRHCPTQQSTTVHAPINQNMKYNKLNIKKLKPGLVASYDVWPENRSVPKMWGACTGQAGDRERTSKTIALCPWSTVRCCETEVDIRCSSDEWTCKSIVLFASATNIWHLQKFICRKKSSPARTVYSGIATWGSDDLVNCVLRLPGAASLKVQASSKKTWPTKQNSLKEKYSTVCIHWTAGILLT